MTIPAISLLALRVQTPEAQALAAMTAALHAGHPLAVAYSGGKDSSVLANLALTAAVGVHQAGGRSLLVITHADVGAVENPEIRSLVRAELGRMQRFAQAQGLDLRVRIARPPQFDSFAVRVIGGRALPAFPDSRRDCTSSWKRVPSERVLRQLAQELRRSGWREPVLMTGVRRDESTVRAGSIARRGEQAAQLWTDQEGRLRLSPLLDWTTDDVWSYLGLCRQGAIAAYSNFDDVLRVYQDAGGSSCVVVADAEMERYAKPCASRFGCWACTAVREDRSLRQMIEGEPGRYGYLRPLAALRDFIAYTQYDWSRRQYIGRTIKNGFISIAADTYAPSMLAELLRYALSAQKATGIEIVSAAQLIAIDARWSLYALAPPFSALRIWQEVEQGRRWQPPAVTPFPKTPVPRYGLIHVGEDWDDEIRSDLVVTGLRDSAWELFGDSCGPARRTLRNGRTVIDVELTAEVDEESAWLFLDFEAERLLGGRAEFEDDWTLGYRTYLRYGLVQPGKGQSRLIDSILRRSQWRQRHQLHGEQDLVELRRRLTVPFARQGELFDGMGDDATGGREEAVTVAD
ncbi:phosphoadenosine phosphosulfate reductase domain-containing protein [Burkholderia vietnamiensis]|uniref:phosphoadenosine phosphosulfate reductase domain-containing protein n=1 Tax=Burkholderia vietnamiensis TaxID=60552 RepID=UPI001D15A9C5|nr:phosphoadenosine phosphosulfate reductase family protein [Burkholderia vietnamiensis]UEC01671.1 phosphoadenosine phosphosulfate reductase family protein [Burkholderia vietnamiensis]